MAKFSGQFTYKTPEILKFCAADHLLNFNSENINNLTEE